MNTLVNKYDSLEQLIYDEHIRIQALDVHKDMDMLLIILNTGFVLQEKLSKYPALQNATTEELLNYKLIGNGTGIHWTAIDEDISLKGILRDAIKTQIVKSKVA
jgi:hypothetical protein